MTEKFGEFKCPYCDNVFFDKKKLDGHIGGAHRRNITETQKPRCKFCNKLLHKNKNWAEWAIKQRNLICIPCKRIQNRAVHRNKRRTAVEESQRRIETIKEKMRNARAIKAESIKKYSIKADTKLFK